MSDRQVVNIPLAEFDRLAETPTRLAQLEAAELLKRGDTAGATARIAAGVAQSTAIRAQAQAPPAPAAVAPAVQPALDPPPRNLGEAMIRHYRERQAALVRNDDPRRDMGQPFGLAAPRPPRT
jgi:hypothetical protein